MMMISLDEFQYFMFTVLLLLVIVVFILIYKYKTYFILWDTIKFYFRRQIPTYGTIYEYYVLQQIYLAVKYREKDKSIYYSLNNYFNTSHDYINKPGYREIFIVFNNAFFENKENFEYSMIRNKIEYRDINYFSKLVLDELEIPKELTKVQYLNIIGRGKRWALTNNCRMHSIRLFAILKTFKIIKFQEEFSNPELLNYWNDLIGLFEKERLKFKDILSNPFLVTGKGRLSAKSVYKSSILIYQFIKELKLTDLAEKIKKELKNEDFIKHYKEEDFK